MALKYVNEIDLSGKNVIVRFDFNVPLSKDGSGQITDTTRVDRALPTIKYILENGCRKLIMMSHLGRPKGEFKPEFSFEPVAKYLAKKLEEEVLLTESCTDQGIKTMLKINDQKIILLQNLRFHNEETKCETNFAKLLASYGDVYINDAFGTSHRKHASTYEIVRYFNKNEIAGGFILKKEIEALSKITENPQTPFVGIMGGAKVSDKIKIIDRLLVNVDKLIIGGAMAYPFLKAKGHNIGKSLCSDEDVSLARLILTGIKAAKLKLPVDHVVSTSPNENAEIVNGRDIPENKMGLDIGPKTVNQFKECLVGAKTVLWNGPMGFFEKENFSKGTFAIANALAELNAFTLVGGGDSVSAIKKSGISDKISHISTGGGASLEFIESGTLPGIQALKFGIE